MRAILLAAAFGLNMVPQSGRAAQAPPPAAASPPAAATTPPASAPEPAAAAREIEAARAAVAAADLTRVARDRAYAAQYVEHLDRLAAAGGDRPDLSVALDSLRLVALPTLERKDEAGVTIDRLLAQRSRDVRFYASPIYAAITIEDDARAVAIVESASQNVPGVAWPELRRLMDRQTMGQLLFGLQTRHQSALRARLAAALFRFGWPGDGELDTADFLRTILIDAHLGRGDNAEAVAVAQGISTPDSVLSMIVRRRYDTVLAPGEDRLALLRAALATRDRTTAEAIAADAGNAKRVLDRVQYLRGLGRNADALALIQPFTRDIRATVSGSPEGMWLINEAAYSLVALGRGDEAVRLMRRMVALPIAGNVPLIGPAINHAALLWETGHAQEAIDYAVRLERDSGQFANDFGKLWLASAIVCAQSALNRNADAAPQIERLRGGRDVNPSAATRAFLCVGDDDAAAALLIHRLESDDPGEAILALQDFTLSSGPSQSGGLFDRLAALRERADVRAALDRVGRVLSLPLARTYWGGF